MVNFFALITWFITWLLTLSGLKSQPPKHYDKGDLIWVCGLPEIDHNERTHKFYLPARDKHNQILRTEMVESNTIRLFYHDPPASVLDPAARGFASRGEFAALCYCDGPSTGADIGQCLKNPDQTIDVKCVFPDPRTYGGGCAYFWARWGNHW